MEQKTRHILWGTLLYFLNIILYTILGPIFRSIQHLTYSQMYALQVLGEVGSFLPLTPYAVRRWNISTRKDGVVYLFLTSATAAYYIPFIYCRRMP
jgi:hypothetical protein